METERSKTRLLEDIDNLSDDEVDAVQGFVNYIKANPQRSKAFRPGYDTRGIELMWRCGQCGNMWERSKGLPENCPVCGSPKEAFYLVEED